MEEKVKFVYSHGTRQKRFRGHLAPGQVVVLISDRAPVIVAAVIIKIPKIGFNLPNSWSGKLEKLYLNYKGLKDDVHGHFTPGPTNPTLANYKAAIDAMKDAYDDDCADVPNSAETLQLKWKIVQRMKRKIVGYVADLCDDNPDEAGEICGDCFLDYSVPMGSEKQIWSATSTSPGVVELTGIVKYGYQCTDWEVCLDPTDPNSWKELKIPPTLAANTTVKNLASKRTYYFRSRVCGKDGPEDWAEIIPVEVK